MPDGFTGWLLGHGVAQAKRIVEDERARRVLDASAHRALDSAVRHQRPEIPDDEVEGVVAGLEEVLWTADGLPLSDQQSSLLVRLSAGLAMRFGTLDRLPAANGAESQAIALELDTSRLAADFLAAFVRALEELAASPAGAGVAPLWTVLASGQEELGHARTHAGLRNLELRAADLVQALGAAETERRELARAIDSLSTQQGSGSSAVDTAVAALEQKLLRELGSARTRGQDEAAAAAAGVLALFRERLSKLPAIVRSPIERYFSMEGQGVASVVVAVTDPDSWPAEVLRSWIAAPPPLLGTLDSPTRPAAWAALGELSSAYGLSGEATVAFRAAVAAGVPRRAYIQARAAWAAFTAEQLETQELVSGDDDEPALRLVRAVYWSTHPDDAPEGWRARARRDIAEWRPVDDVDRDLRGLLAATIELLDESRPDPEGYAAAASVLTEAIAQGHLDDTSVALGRILVARAAGGRPENRWADLERAKALALRARDSYRSCRRGSCAAVRLATGAAAMAGQPREVIRLGSAQHGEATPDEAADPEIFQRVLLAALQVDSALVAEMAQRAERELPDGFVRRWSRALVAGGPTSLATTDARIGLWQEALEAATNDDERREALQGLAFAGDDQLPGIDDLLEPWTAAELRARAVLERGDDARLAISLLHPHRHAAPSAADALAHAYVSIGEIDAAVTTLTEAAQHFDHDRLVVVAAMICYRAGLHDRAEGLLTGVLQTATTAWAGRAEALSILGELQARRGAWTEAIASWRSALEADTDREGTRWQLAGALARRGEHATAWNVLVADRVTPGFSPRDLDPETHAAAYLLLFLGVRFGDPRAIAEIGLELVERYEGNEEFVGRSLTLLLVAGGIDRGAYGTTPPDGDGVARDPEILPEPIVGRLARAIGRFVAAHPDSPFLQRQSGTPAQLADQMTALARARLHQADELGELLLAVQRGDMPLGVLCGATSKPYALVVATQVAGVLSAVGDPDEHRAGVDDSLNVLGVKPVTQGGQRDTSVGSPVLLTAALLPIQVAVVDGAALYALCQLPEKLVELLTSGVRSLVLADEAYIDIIAAQDSLALNSGGTWVIDSATGEGRGIRLDPAVLQGHRASIRRVLELAEKCRREATLETSHPDLDDLSCPEYGPWLAGLRIAAASGAAVWSDDIAVRRLARGFGIPTFSTMALLDAHAQLGRVVPNDREDAIRAWTRAGIGDFEPDAARLRALAAEDSASRGAVLSAITKPAWWSDVPRAMEICLALGNDFAGVDSGFVADLVYCGVLGSARSRVAEEAFSRVAALLTAVSMRDVGPTGNPARILEAARTAMRGTARDAPDLLERVGRHILASLEPAIGAELAAASLRALTAQLSQTDRETISRVILDPGPRKEAS